jgi:hypothetical protein
MPREHRRTYTRMAHTRVAVALHTDERGGLNIPSPVYAHPLLGKIIACSTHKEFGSASGTWSLTIKKSPELGSRSALRAFWRDPEDVWVQLYFDVDGQRAYTMLGLVDTINEDTKRSGNGERAETYTINGRDFGKVFEQQELFVNFHHAPERPLLSQSELTSTWMDKILGTPEAFVRTLLEVWVGNNGVAEQQWLLPSSLGGGYLYGMLAKRIERMKNTVNGETLSPTLFQLDQTGGKLWDVLQEYSHGLLNEMWVDLAPKAGANPKELHNWVPAFYLRERPFPTRSPNGATTITHKWHGLRAHVLRPGDVNGRQIAKGGASQRYNYWQLQMQGIGTEGFNVDEILQNGIDGIEPGFPGNLPIWNNDSIARHGLRRYTASTKFVPFWDQKRQAIFHRLAGEWLKRVHDWYVVAPFELSGQITTTRVMPEIRVGELLVEERAEGRITYYVEGVAHDWSFPGTGRTTLTVTRGEYEGDDLLDYVYDQYANPQTLSAREQCFLPHDAEFDELIQGLARGCRERAVNVDEGEGFTVEDGGAGEQGEQTALESERSDFEPEPEAPIVEDEGMERALESEEVGTAEEIPSPNEPPPQEPTLDREQLERGDPIDTSGLDGLDLNDGDPLAGILDEEGL